MPDILIDSSLDLPNALSHLFGEALKYVHVHGDAREFHLRDHRRQRQFEVVVELSHVSLVEVFAECGVERQQYLRLVGGRLR